MKTSIAVLFAAVLVLASASRAHAWGAVHEGYTHVGPNGVQHVGYTAAAGPGGAYGGAHYGAAGAGGAAYGGAHYGAAGYGGAAAGGYHYSYGGYGAAAGGAAGGYHYGAACGTAGVYRAY